MRLKNIKDKYLFHLIILIALMLFSNLVFAKGNRNPEKEAKIINKQLKKNQLKGESEYLFDFRGEYFDILSVSEETKNAFNEVAETYQEKGINVVLIVSKPYLTGLESREELDEKHRNYVKDITGRLPANTLALVLISELESSTEENIGILMAVGGDVDLNDIPVDALKGYIDGSFYEQFMESLMANPEDCCPPDEPTLYEVADYLGQIPGGVTKMSETFEIEYNYTIIPNYNSADTNGELIYYTALQYYETVTGGTEVRIDWVFSPKGLEDFKSNTIEYLKYANAIYLGGLAETEIKFLAGETSYYDVLFDEWLSTWTPENIVIGLGIALSGSPVRGNGIAWSRPLKPITKRPSFIARTLRGIGNLFKKVNSSPKLPRIINDMRKFKQQNYGGVREYYTFGKFEIKQGLILRGGKRYSGKGEFIITEYGELRIGKGHDFLSGNAEAVGGAGQITIVNGKIVYVNNHSGHFFPTKAEMQQTFKWLKSKRVVHKALTNPFYVDGTLDK